MTAQHVKRLKPRFFSWSFFPLFAGSACHGFGLIVQQSGDGFGLKGNFFASCSPQNKILNDQAGKSLTDEELIGTGLDLVVGSEYEENCCKTCCTGSYLIFVTGATGIPV